MLTRTQPDFGAVGKLDGNALHLAVERIFGGQRLHIALIGDKPLRPSRLAIGFEQRERVGRYLIDRARAVHRAGWVVGIVERDACQNELVHSLASDGFAGVGLVFLAIVQANPVHNRRDADERRARPLPLHVGLQIE
jgi:hypothetical protein